jgi:GNAT superfamily N-acetyltransferase
VEVTEVTGAVARVGKARALRVHAALAAEAGEPLFDVCDAHSQELHNLHTLLYEPDGYSFREGLVRRYDADDWDLLVLDYVVLDPKWRGLKVGLLAVRRMVDVLGGGCGLAVSCIAPVRRKAHKLVGVPKSWLPRPASREERRIGLLNLRRYYRRMGFRRLGRTPYYALPLNQVTPTAEEILRGKVGE